MTGPFDVIVIGTGVAGMTAARLARDAGLATAMVESLFYGGLITNVNHLDAPALGSGPDYAAGLMSAAIERGAQNFEAVVTAIEPAPSGFVVGTESGDHAARAVIVASGASIRPLGIPGEAEFEGRGVSTCADCDGPLFAGAEVVVVGGGDSAVQEAAVLAGYARRVQMIHRGDAFRARAHLIENLAALGNVVVHWRTRVETILGAGSVEAVEIVGPDGAPGRLPCAGVFAYAGLAPACGFVPAAVSRDEGGYLVTDPFMRTSVPGLFAAGVVRAGNGGTIADAEADAEAAVSSASALLGG